MSDANVQHAILPHDCRPKEPEKSQTLKDLREDHIGLVGLANLKVDHEWRVWIWEAASLIPTDLTAGTNDVRVRRVDGKITIALPHASRNRKHPFPQMAEASLKTFGYIPVNIIE